MSHCTSNVTSGFIDLATYDELEKYMYGGPEATAYFVRETRKSTWFTMVPVALQVSHGTAGFGQEMTVNISRAGDYLLHTWLRVCLPAVESKDPSNNNIFWTPNLMHNLVEKCRITFNDMDAASFDSHHLDFWTAFTVPKSKRVGYDNMIGNTSDLTTPAQSIDAKILNLPLPFFYTRDSGVALPTAALPYNDMKIHLTLRSLDGLLSKIGRGSGVQCPEPVTANDVTVGALKAHVWANYAIVSNDERKRMGCAPRDILIEQVQKAHSQSFIANGTDDKKKYDIRFSHAVKVLFFGAENARVKSVRSNYTTATPCTDASGVFAQVGSAGFSGSDPILTTSLIYENTCRLSEMGSDYYSCVNPYYHAVSIPEVTGYHSYSYSLDFDNLDPMGSTNYGKLTNVSLIPGASAAALAAAKLDEKFNLVVSAVNNNIVRISGGALGFPVL